MNILVYGNKRFDDYSTFMRGLVVAIENNLYENEKHINVYAGGPLKINQFVAEFVNKTNIFFKQKGYKIKFQRLNPKDLSSEFDRVGINQVLYFSTKDDHAEIFDSVISKANNMDIPTSIYKL